MKLAGIILLVFGLLFGAHALTMDVGVDVPAQDFGDGVAVPAMRVANVDLMTRRQNYLVFSGVLAVVGAILTGFASLRPPRSQGGHGPLAPPPSPKQMPTPKSSIAPSSVSICPNCRSMGPGDLSQCSRCGTQLT